MTTNPRRAAATLGALALCIGVVTATLAAPADPARSQLKFGFTQMGVSTDGEFKKFAADVAFDPAKPEAGKVTVSVDLGAVDAGSSEANEMIRGKDFFDSAKFPKATFTSTAIKAAGAGRFQAEGTLSLKGRTGNVSVPFTARPEGGGLLIEGSVPVSRTAYHVGDGDWADTSTLADAVQIRFKLFVPK